MTECTVQELFDLFLKTNNLQQLIETAAGVLKNPLLVCDTSYHFLARSSVREVKDKSWLEGMKRRSWSYDLVSRINSLDLDYTGRENTTFVLESINPDSTSRRKLGMLCIDGVHVGYYFVLENRAPFESIPEETYRQVGAILAKCVCTDRSLQVPGGGGNGERIMLDLLQNGFENRRLFLERAAEHELSRIGSYRVFCIVAGRDGASVERGNLQSAIGQCLPLSWQASLPGCIVVLADFNTRPYRQEETPEQFRRFLAAHGLCAGQSDTFSDPFYLKRYYEQARAAAYLGRAFRDGRQVIPYEDYKIYNLFLNVQGEDVFEQYSSEVIRRVYEYDMTNGTEYLETVTQYLACGRSVQKAAEKLYVHRNTVAYRIGRAKELFAMRFDDDEKNVLTYLSCLLRRYCDRFVDNAKGKED